MTNAQKWVAVFLVLFVLLLALSRLTNKEKSSSGSNFTEESVNFNEQQIISPEKIISENRCLTCHGRDLGGSAMGPAIINLSDNWDKATLINYLQGPSSFLNIARMAILRERYGRDMPAVKNLSAQELDTLAEFLLKLKSK